jgi:sugar phosphate isomerase/epimerase
LLVTLAVSTLFVSHLDDPAGMARALTALPVQGVEIGYRLKETTLKRLIGLLKAAHIPVVSLHHPVPLPNDAQPETASGDRLALSSPWREERQAGIAAALKTLQLASDLEAGAVVFHLGSIPELEPLWAEFRRHYFEKLVESEEAALFRGEAVARRRELAAPYVDRAMLSLERLLIPAEHLGVRIGLETRYHFHEVASPNEIARILETFRGAVIGYWHDTGHAEVQERVGLTGHRALLERFQDSFVEGLVGVHLHDVDGLTDHLPPGAGSLDWRGLAPLLARAPIKVLEVSPGPPREQMMEGMQLLDEAGIA